MKIAKRIDAVTARLETQLKAVNDEVDAGNNVPLNNLREDFTVNINGCTVSLGSMDTYGKFLDFMNDAALDAADDEESLDRADIVHDLHELRAVLPRDTDDADYEKYLDKLLDKTMQFTLDGRSYTTGPSVKLLDTMIMALRNDLYNYDVCKLSVKEAESIHFVNDFELMY